MRKRMNGTEVEAEGDERRAGGRLVTVRDPIKAAQLFTRARVNLFRAIKAEHKPATITDIAARLGRDRSSVGRDIETLARAGLVSVEITPNPGHGTCKVVRAVAQRVSVLVLID